MIYTPSHTLERIRADHETAALNRWYDAEDQADARAEHLDDAQTRADAMDHPELWGWVDDMDAILALMSPESRADYYRAHRQLVASALVEVES